MRDGLEQHLPGTIRFLWAFPMIRREWRMEMASWNVVDHVSMHFICHEALAGYWGVPSRHAELLVAPWHRVHNRRLRYVA